MTMSAPRWSARALECASAKALGLCQTSSAGGVYSPRARAWADGDVRLRGPRLPGGYRRPLRRRWRRPAPSPPPRRPRRRWRGVAGGGTSISSVVSRISLSWSALVPMVKGARFSARKCRDRQAAGWTGHPVRNAWGECGFPRGGRSSRWARHHALSARDPEQLPVGACVRDCCSTVYLRWSEIKGGHRKDRIRRTHVRRCHPRSGGEAPGAGKVPLSSARLIGCAPKAVGDAWLIPTRARRSSHDLIAEMTSFNPVADCPSATTSSPTATASIAFAPAGGLVETRATLSTSVARNSSRRKPVSVSRRSGSAASSATRTYNSLLTAPPPVERMSRTRMSHARRRNGPFAVIATESVTPNPRGTAEDGKSRSGGYAAADPSRRRGRHAGSVAIRIVPLTRAAHARRDGPGAARRYEEATSWRQQDGPATSRPSPRLGATSTLK